MPECTNTMEAVGLEDPHRWGIILPNSSRVSLLTYKAIIAVRYPELVLHDQDPIQIGHFVAHDHTVEYGGFRTVLWNAPKDLRTAVEDVGSPYPQRRHRDLSQGATAQLLVLCNRTAVHNHFFCSWCHSPYCSHCSNRVWLLSGGRRGASADERGLLWSSDSGVNTGYTAYLCCLPLDMSGMIEMAQTLAVYHYRYHTSRLNRYIHMNRLLSQMQQPS